MNRVFSAIKSIAGKILQFINDALHRRSSIPVDQEESKHCLAAFRQYHPDKLLKGSLTRSIRNTIDKSTENELLLRIIASYKYSYEKYEQETSGI